MSVTRIQMYYKETPEKNLRFGDVIRGFILAAINIDKPNTSLQPEPYSIEVETPQFCVVLSPCCSIEDKTVLLTSLIKVTSGFFDNPYFSEDLTRINRDMEPHEMVAPSIWNKFPEEEQTKRKNDGRGYALNRYFIYPENDLLPKYQLKKRDGNTIETGYYMIDFLRTYKVNSEIIVKGGTAPASTKYLQLTPTARQELRDKIAYFYGRVPDEDKILLSA